LADNANPAAVIFVGPASTGKTTVATMFGGSMCYRSDKFTPAAFVSHSAKATQAQLNSIDLLPRIQHKVLNTPELSTMFRGKPDELLERSPSLHACSMGKGSSVIAALMGDEAMRVTISLPGWVVPRRLIPLSGELWHSLVVGCSFTR
jgi:hypothetical protein